MRIFCLHISSILLSIGFIFSSPAHAIGMMGDPCSGFMNLMSTGNTGCPASQTSGGFNECPIRRWQDYLTCRVTTAIKEEEKILKEGKNILTYNSEVEKAYFRGEISRQMATNYQKPLPERYEEIISERAHGIRNDNCFNNIIFYSVREAIKVCDGRRALNVCETALEEAREAKEQADRSIASKFQNGEKVSPIAYVRDLQFSLGNHVNKLNQANTVCVTEIMRAIGPESGCEMSYKNSLFLNQKLAQRVERHCTVSGLKSSIDGFVSYMNSPVSPARSISLASDTHIKNKRIAIYAAQKFTILTHCLDEMEQKDDLNAFVRCLGNFEATQFVEPSSDSGYPSS